MSSDDLADCAALCWEEPSGGVGRAAGAPRSRGVWEFLRQQRGRIWVEFLPGLRAGIESGGVSVVPLEAARASELLPGYIRSVKRSRPPSAATDASPIDSRLRFLGTGRAVSIVERLDHGRF
jgi:hypothetical protein